MEALDSATPESLRQLAHGCVLPLLRGRGVALHRRAPPGDDPSRWRVQRIGGRDWRIALPITLTPYAATRPCSARCRFCSETLVPLHGGTRASRLRPRPDHAEALAAALRELRGLPLSLSLSGLEYSDDVDWCLTTLRVLGEAGEDGPMIDERVLYSNGAGFAGPRGDALIMAFRDFGLTRIELSRHHHEAARNQSIMRFRDGESIADGATFERTLARLQSALPVRLVVIVQRGGVVDADDVGRYLDWAGRRGVKSVVFREFSQLGDHYRDGAPKRFIERERVATDGLLREVLVGGMLRPVQATEGYYFWNVHAVGPGGIEAIFESSDYVAMHARHAEAVHKLVFHADGRLCAGWEPDRDVLWRFHRD
jgi:hypothetical protein